MALATNTTTVYLQTPRADATGYNWMGGNHVTSGRTLSDIILITKIPNKANIVDYYVRGTTGETASVFKLGINSAGGTETTFGTGTLSVGAVVTYRPMTGIPFRVSLSDTDAQAGATVYMTVSAGTWTTSVSFDFAFFYFMDGRAVF